MDRKIKTRQVHKDIKVLDKTVTVTDLSLIHISEPTRHPGISRMPSAA